MGTAQPHQPKICGVLLAAGCSQRFGVDDKLLQPLANGLSMITQSVRTMVSALDWVTVIVPPDAAALSHTLADEAVEIIINPEPESGMASSVGSAVTATSQADGWIIGLADMPWIQATTISKIIAAMNNGHSLVAPRYQFLRGHPVGFGKMYREVLLQLEGDTGARTVLKQYRSHLHYLDVNDPGILMDVDTPADLKQQSRFKI